MTLFLSFLGKTCPVYLKKTRLLKTAFRVVAWMNSDKSDVIMDNVHLQPFKKPPVLTATNCWMCEEIICKINFLRFIRVLVKKLSRRSSGDVMFICYYLAQHKSFMKQEDLLRSRRGNKSTYITSQKEIKGRVAISLAVFLFWYILILLPYKSQRWRWLRLTIDA